MSAETIATEPGNSPPLVSLLASLSKSERSDPAQLRSRQAQLLNGLILHHFTSNLLFRQRLENARINPEKIKDFELLNALPPMTRHEVQSAGPAFATDNVPDTHQPVGRVKTSGSTGEPVALLKTRLNSFYWAAFAIRDHLWNHRDFAGRMSSIRANVPNYVELEDWGPPVNQVYKTGRGQGIPITTPIDAQLALVQRFAPNVLLVYPNNLRAFADIWQSTGFDLQNLRHIKTIGETVSDDLRYRVRSSCGFEIEDNYSSQEAGPIAIQCPEGRLYHVMAEALIVEVLGPGNESCVPGQVGRIVVTDLLNHASPLIRYAIGDFAEPGGECACGKTLPTLKRILGRERNLLKHPNGDRHWPLVGFHSFDSIAPVRQYQFIQHSLAEIELRIVTDEELTPAQHRALIEIAATSLGRHFNYKLVNTQQRLPANANGKFEEFVCYA